MKRSEWLVRLVTTASVLCFLSTAHISRAAGAELGDCSPTEAAGKPAPPVAEEGPDNAFRILWHIGTQIEDLADGGQDPEIVETIADIQAHVDGYYFLVLEKAGLAYWPDRPAECALNLKRAKEAGDREADDLQKTCDKSLDKSMAQRGTGDPKGIAKRTYIDALNRLLLNLDIRGEQGRGKIIVAEMLLVNSDFTYDEKTDELSLDRSPKAYCFLNSAGIPLNNVLAYQEPELQVRRNKFLFVPAEPAGKKTDESINPRRHALPWNSRIVDLLGDAFSEQGIPLSQFSINIRQWNSRWAKANVGRLLKSRYFGGFFFEGGTEIISLARHKKKRINNFAKGIAWILTNTDEKIFLLMPGFWEKGQADNDEERDKIIDRLRVTITQLNEKVGERLGLESGEQALCNERIYLIPASYGSPTHVKALPPTRNGALAGTVTGQIKLLAEMRQELCGTPG